MKRLFPSGDRIGQPSSDVVLSSELLPAISSIFCAVLQSESAGAADAVAVIVRTRTAVSLNVMVVSLLIAMARGRSRPGTRARPEGRAADFCSWRDTTDRHPS